LKSNFNSIPVWIARYARYSIAIVKLVRKARHALKLYTMKSIQVKHAKMSTQCRHIMRPSA